MVNKIIACIGLSIATIALCIADPLIGYVALISSGVIMWGISAS